MHSLWPTGSFANPPAKLSLDPFEVQPICIREAPRTLDGPVSASAIPREKAELPETIVRVPHGPRAEAQSLGGCFERTTKSVATPFLDDVEIESKNFDRRWRQLCVYPWRMLERREHDWLEHGLCRGLCHWPSDPL